MVNDSSKALEFTISQFTFLCTLPLHYNAIYPAILGTINEGKASLKAAGKICLSVNIHRFDL